MAELNKAYDTLDFGKETVGDARVQRNDNNGVKLQIRACARRTVFVLLIALGILLLVAVLILQLLILNRLKGSCEETDSTSKTVGATLPELECERPWIPYKHSCYLSGENEIVMTFWESVEYCEEKNAHLVYIEDEDENYFIGNFSKDHGLYAWIGLTDTCTEGVWQWFGTTKQVLFTKWTPGEPNDDKEYEDCGHLYTSNGQWNDAPCNQSFVPICERFNLKQ